MPCNKPLPARQLADGSIQFQKAGHWPALFSPVIRSLQIPCGGCVGCRLDRAQMWAARCVHESKSYEVSSFVTLTYSDENYRPSLEYGDFQAFLKRLRWSLSYELHGPPRKNQKKHARFFPRMSFYMCGEYGDRFLRPHFHACLFGVGFPDRKFLKSLPGGSTLYRSAQLERLWTMGFSSVGDVTFESAAYVARYVMKKITGKDAAKHYERVDAETGEVFQVAPEFNRMSLRPAIGRGWIEKYHPEVLVRDGVVMNGRRVKTPRYYDGFLADKFPVEFEAIQLGRAEMVKKFRKENTPQRLRAREAIAKARLSSKKRSLE